MPRVYQVLKWSDNFENNKSRERDACSFVCVPNKQHGMGLTYMLSQPDGACIYGIWCLIIGALSQQHKPRNGWLTDNGQEAGRPWTDAMMALRWRRPVAEVSRALEVLTSEAVGWMKRNEIQAVPAECPSGAMNGSEEKEENGREVPQSTEVCSEPGKPAAEPDPVVMTIPCRGNPSQWKLLASKRSKWAALFPDLNIDTEIAKAVDWLDNHPQKRKTATGMAGYIGGWLGRAQNGNGARREPEPAAGKSSTDPFGPTWEPREPDAEINALIAEAAHD